MTILRVKEVRRKEPTPRAYERVDVLNAEENANAVKALRVLRMRQPNWQAVADEMRVNIKILERFTTGKHRMPVGLALRAARAAGASLEDVLSGAWPKPGTCPMCGRGGEPQKH